MTAKDKERASCEVLAAARSALALAGQIPGKKKEALRPLLCDPSDALRIEFGAGNETHIRLPSR